MITPAAASFAKAAAFHGEVRRVTTRCLKRSETKPSYLLIGDNHDTDLPNLLDHSIVEHRPDFVPAGLPLGVEATPKGAIPASNYISVLGVLCPRQKCIVYASKTAPLQFDKSRLTTEGAAGSQIDRPVRLRPYAAFQSRARTLT